MYITFVEQLAPHCFPCSAFKQNIIRDDNSSTAMLLKQCLHMLKEIKLLVRCRCPKILALIHQSFPVCCSFAIYESDAAFLSERRISEHYLEAITRVAGK